MARRGIKEFEQGLQKQIDTAVGRVHDAQKELEVAQAALDALYAVRGLADQQKAARATKGTPVNARPRRKRAAAFDAIPSAEPAADTPETEQ